jgi:hypothetical protein
MLHDSLVTFLRQEHRNGTLRADPDQVCTVTFLEHLMRFIEEQKCQCLICDAVAADYARQVENLQRLGE